ncbi:MAG: response regulator transcription factor [Clostridia bacterium]|nr:response regulator transcription factor [Clostridia bacterium]
MYNVAIVEDDKNQSKVLKDYIIRYGTENKRTFNITCFYDASSFFKSDSFSFDVIFMDIELPDGNGMEVVRKMRETNKKTLVIFVTNLAQYAIKGYEVKAFDFIVKPVSYYNFVLKMVSVLDCLSISRDIEVLLKTNEGIVKLKTSDITYIEVVGHYLTYHTLNGVYVCSGSISSAANELRSFGFSFCNRCYLVNLKYVTKITQSEVIVNGEGLVLTRHKRANFLKDLNNFLQV